MTRRWRWALPLAVMAACAFPTDRSGELTVQMSGVPTLLVGDTLRLAVHVVAGTSDTVAGPLLAFASSNPGVVVVDSTGLVRGVGVGIDTVTVTALGFASAVPATREVRVRSRLSVDSVTGDGGHYGDLLDVYGVGLRPESLFFVRVGGVDATIDDWTPLNASEPDLGGRLRLWLTAPAPARSALQVAGFEGFAALADSLTLITTDLYEPNDTVPFDLGTLNGTFYNPALALEPVDRASDPADWFRFTTATAGDLTITFAEGPGAGTAGAPFLSNDLSWKGAGNGRVAGPLGWTAGPTHYTCDGHDPTSSGSVVPITQTLGPVTTLAVHDLPAGTYDLVVPYTSPAVAASYSLKIAPGYTSALPPDHLENNDWCDVAATLPALDTLTIDNPHEPEWFKFTLTQNRNVRITATALSAAGDLDIYIMKDQRPGNLSVVGTATGSGTTEVFNQTLGGGDYLMLIVDFPGVATQYILKAENIH